MLIFIIFTSCPPPFIFFFFFLMIRRPPRSTLFPYTTSSDLLAVLDLREMDGGRAVAVVTLHLVPFVRTRSCKLALVSRSEEHTSELQSHVNLVCRLLLEKKKTLAHAASESTQKPHTICVITL